MTIASRHTCEAHTPLSRARSGGWRYIGLSKFQIDGIVPVIPTPFDADEEIDWAALRSLLDFAAVADVGAVCLPSFAIDIPLIIQDFNPGGSSVSPRFVAELHRTHPHFRYVKLEEPLMSKKVEAILQETSGAVGVIEGWGGMFMLELIPCGICGVMSGLGISDILACAFRLAKV